MLTRCGLLDCPYPARNGVALVTPEVEEAGMRTCLKLMSDAQASGIAAAARVRCPCLMVRAEKSDILSVSGVGQWRDLVPHAESVDVSNAHHMVIGDEADAFAQCIVSWIGKVLRQTGFLAQPESVDSAAARAPVSKL